MPLSAICFLSLVSVVRMKIVHLCLGNFFIDNYSYQENMLPKYHRKMGYDVTVIASLFTFNKEGKGCYLDGFSEYDDENGFHVVRLPYKSPLKYNRTFRHYQRFQEILEREKPDIIFSHNVSYGDIKVLVKYLRKHPDVKVFADNHADFINSAKNFLSKRILHPVIWRYYAKLLEPYLSKCYGVTPMRCRFLKEMYHINENIVEYLPLGVDDDLIPNNRGEVRSNIRKELSIDDDSIIIITGGKIDKLKNTHILLEALNKLNDNNLHLIICGTLTPEMEYLMEIIEKNVHIHYLGWCNAERVMACMVASDIACFPGTHSTLWEQAVGVGLPSIFKRWHEMEHVNVNGNCEFVKGEDVNELAEVIERFTNRDYFKSKSMKAIEASRRFLYSEISHRAIQDSV